VPLQVRVLPPAYTPAYTVPVSLCHCVSMSLCLCFLFLCAPAPSRWTCRYSPSPPLTPRPTPSSAAPAWPSSRSPLTWRHPVLTWRHPGPLPLLTWAALGAPPGPGGTSDQRTETQGVPLGSSWDARCAPGPRDICGGQGGGTHRRGTGQRREQDREHHQRCSRGKAGAGAGAGAGVRAVAGAGAGTGTGTGAGRGRGRGGLRRCWRGDPLVSFLQ